MRVGGAYFSLTACALRAFGADAVRECGWWSVHSGTSITGCSDLPLCKKYALKRTTPSIAADRCRSLVRNLQGCTYPAHCAATAETEAPQNKFAAVHPRTPKQSAHHKKDTHRTAISCAPHQRGARSRERAASLSGTKPHNVLSTCTAK